MGAWGIGPFDNDEALDFVADILETNDLSRIKTALNQAIPELNDSSLLESDKASRALVAAEVISSMRGFSVDLPESLFEWSKDKGIPSSELRLTAHSAVLRVLNHSDLRLLWEETTEFDEWRTSVRNLLERLSSPKEGITRKAGRALSKMGKTTAYTCCFCGENIPSGDLITLTMKRSAGFEQNFWAHDSCFQKANILNPRGNR